jgi:hypothetical protein
MKINKLLMLLFAVLLISASLTLFIYSHFIIKDVLFVEAHVEVGDYVGFNLDTDKLYFGTVFPGGKAERGIIIQHYKTGPSIVTIRVEGDASRWITPKYPAFVLFNETKEVVFTVHPPSDAAYGNYTATIKFFFKKI